MQSKIRNIQWLFALVLFAASAGLRGDPALPPALAGKYALFWSDEFDGTTLDASKWNYRKLGPRGAAIDAKDMVALDGQGHLVLTVRRVGDTIHAAMIGTQGKFETTYGYFECRAKLQKSYGPGSAFWLQSPTIGRPVGNPKAAGAEIDIFEYFDPTAKRVPHTLHWDGYGVDHQSTGSKGRLVADLADGFHTFGVEWTPEKYVFYVDGEESFRTRQAVSQAREYLILSYLAEEDWQAEAVNKVPGFSDSVVFDYVRVYKKNPAASEPPR
jgi:beta-glucanase (GH16 family)